MNVSITKSAANPPSENIGMTRNSVKKIEKLNTVSAEELKSKLRSKSVSKAEVEEGDQQSLSQTKRNKFGKHSSSSLLKEKIGSSQNYFINNVKINANMSNKNIIQLEYDTKESIVKNPLLSDNPITMKVSEAKIVESWKDFDEVSEPITPVKLTDTINKEFKTNNSNIVSFVSKKTKKKSPKKIVKEKHRSIPSRVEKIEEANEKNKQQKVIVSKKIQIKENLKVQVSQNKFKTLNDIKPPNTIKYKTSKIQPQLQSNSRIAAQPLTQRDMKQQIENNKFSNTITKTKSPMKPQIGWSKGFSLQMETNFVNNRRGSQLLPKIGH